MAKGDPLGLVGVSLAGLLAACQTTASDPPSPQPVAPGAGATTEGAPSQAWPPIDWAKAPDCQAKLALLADAVQAGRVNADEHPPIAVALPGPSDRRDWLAAPSVTIAADLPLEVHQRTDPALLETPCLLLVEPARDQRGGQRLVSQDNVRSLYESGVRTERNPEYEAAQIRVRKAERAAKDDGPGLMKVGDPLLDLFGLLVGGVISGFSQGGRERELDDATATLIETPRSVDRPVYRAYQFERQVVVAGKEASIAVALVDRPQGRIWRAELRQRERREFEILEGLDPRDKDYETYAAGSLTRHDFERWQREPPRLQLSAIAAALRDAPPAGASERSLAAALGRPESASVAPAPWPSADRAPARSAPPDARDQPLAAVAAGPQWLAEPRADRAGPAPRARAQGLRGRAEPRSSLAFDARFGAAPRPLAGEPGPARGAGPGAALGADPRAASVVRVGAGSRSGGGVYVRADLVLTTAQLVDGGSVVDIATADGARVLGLVARRDLARNLALVQVAYPGPPVTFYDGPPIQPGRPVEAIALAEGAGVILTPGRYPSGSAAADLEAVKAGVLPAQPEGLPWFLGDRVVGVGGSAADASAEGAPISVRASQVLDFLYGAGGALAGLP